LVFFKNRCSPEYLEDIKTGRARSVSIGFFFDCIPQSGEFKGQHYDYVKKDILIDHVAVGSWQGRCSYPLCGIGVDTLKGADPYPNEHSCRLKDPETLNIVGSGERNTTAKSTASFTANQKTSLKLARLSKPTATQLKHGAKLKPANTAKTTAETLNQLYEKKVAHQVTSSACSKKA
jgi:hypothetical protein